MFSLFKKSTRTTNAKEKTTTFHITGTHCTSCSINIDGELEETVGVLKANTSYAQAKTVVVYNSTQTEPETLKKIIESLHYTVAMID